MEEAGRGAQTLMSIKEVAERTGLAPSTIRYYDQQFEEFLGVSRGAGRRRLFAPETVLRLLEIQRLLKDQGLSLRQARQALAGGQAPAEPPGRETAELAGLRQEVDQLREEVKALERRLRGLREIQERTLALVDSLTRA